MLFSDGNMMLFSVGNMASFSDGNMALFSDSDMRLFRDGIMTLFHDGNMTLFNHGNLTSFSDGDMRLFRDGEVQILKEILVVSPESLCFGIWHEKAHEHLLRPRVHRENRQRSEGSVTVDLEGVQMDIAKEATTFECGGYCEYPLGSAMLAMANYFWVQS